MLHKTIYVLLYVKIFVFQNVCLVYLLLMSHNITGHKREFLEYLEIEKGRSLKTIENYDRYLSKFFSHAEIASPGDITLPLVREYRLWLNRQTVNKRGDTMSRRTQNYHLIALRSFLKFLAKNDISTLAPEKIELAKTAQRELDLISRTEFQRLMIAPSGSEIEDLRDKAILEMLYSTGLRVSELCSLNEDLDLSSDEFSIRGKGEKVRIVFLSEAAKSTVTRYLKKRHEGKKKVLSEALFVSSSGERIYPRMVQRILKKRAVQAGITKHVTPHTMRHYFATDLLQNGADIRSVQMLLGHASINTTQVYTNLSDKHLKEIHKKFHNN